MKTREAGLLRHLPASFHILQALGSHSNSGGTIHPTRGAISLGQGFRTVTKLPVKLNIGTWHLGTGCFKADSPHFSGEGADSFLIAEVCVLWQQGLLCTVIPPELRFTDVHTTHFLEYDSSDTFTQFLSEAYFNVFSPNLGRGNSVPLTKLQLISFIPRLDSIVFVP